MVYTDGNFLVSDTPTELHRLASELALSRQRFSENPFPHYKLSYYDQELYRQLGIKHMSTIDLLRCVFRLQKASVAPSGHH